MFRRNQKIKDFYWYCFDTEQLKERVCFRNAQTLSKKINDYVDILMF